jgi:uncharacterized protein
MDQAGVLSPSTIAALEAELAAHEDSTSNQIVVLTIPSLEDEVLEPYATRVFREWGLGLEERDNGVLVLVAVQDRRVRIEVGYGLEGDLTDATAGSIIRYEIVPRFKQGDFDAGVLEGVSAILQSVEGTYSPPEPDSSPFWLFPTLIGIPLALFLTIGLARQLANGSEETVVEAAAGPLVVGGLIVLTLPDLFGWRWTLLAIAVLVVFAAFRWWLNRWAEAHPRWGKTRRHNRAKRQAFRAARLRGDKRVVVDGKSYSVPARSSSSSGGSSSSFSGGGGSSGGGGASGSW